MIPPEWNGRLRKVRRRRRASGRPISDMLRPQVPSAPAAPARRAPFLLTGHRRARSHQVREAWLLMQRQRIIHIRAYAVLFDRPAIRRDRSGQRINPGGRCGRVWDAARAAQQREPRDTSDKFEISARLRVRIRSIR